MTRSFALCFFLGLIVAATVDSARAQGGVGSIKTVHFDIQYQAGVSDDEARRVADYLESDYEYLSKKLGMDFGKTPEVRLYDSGSKYIAETRQTRSSRGATFQRGILHLQPVKMLEERKELEQTLSFELASALLENAALKGCPRWLRESFAVYHSGEMSDLSPPIGVKLQYFSDLDQDIQQYPDPPKRDDVHYVLGTTMRFFVEQFEAEKAFSVFKAFDGTTSLEDVFKNIFGQEFPEIERAWAKYILSASESFKKKKDG